MSMWSIGKAWKYWNSSRVRERTLTTISSIVFHTWPKNWQGKNLTNWCFWSRFSLPHNEISKQFLDKQCGIKYENSIDEIYFSCSTLFLGVVTLYFFVFFFSAWFSVTLFQISNKELRSVGRMLLDRFLSYFCDFGVRVIRVRALAKIAVLHYTAPLKRLFTLTNDYNRI